MSTFEDYLSFATFVISNSIKELYVEARKFVITCNTVFKSDKGKQLFETFNLIPCEMDVIDIKQIYKKVNNDLIWKDIEKEILSSLNINLDKVVDDYNKKIKEIETQIEWVHFLKAIGIYSPLFKNKDYAKTTIGIIDAFMKH